MLHRPVSRIWKLVREPIKPIEPEHLKALPIKAELSLKGGPDKVREKAGAALKSAGFNFSESKDGSGYQLFSEKGRHTRLGIYITHFSILLIFIGAIIGIYFGFVGVINLPEGAGDAMLFTRMDHMPTPGDKEEQNVIAGAVEASWGSIPLASQKLGVTEERLRGRMKALGMRPLEFFIRCDDFNVEFYQGTDMPKSYTSLLSVIEGGREVMNKWITVNSPLKYKGITFYQSSYGIMPDLSDMVHIIKVTSVRGESETLRLRQGEKFLIPGTSIEAQVADFSPALSFDASGKPFTYAQTMTNPAVHLDIKDGKEESHKWVLKRYPASGALLGGHSVQLLDLWGVHYTGLQVRKDPGVWVVYLGCLVMSIGLYIAFFMSHRRIWFRLQPEKGGTVKITIGAYANKNKLGFERKVDKIVSRLREGGK